MEHENLISIYAKLLAVLECPVCLDYLTKPVALCNEGHALCSKCNRNLSNCPMCRNPISTTRGLIVDQIIETLLYPCFNMGCGSLLKRPEAENHDQICTSEVATDKQAVLQNNLLKNIEENFAPFIVQPEIVKETRTVGTFTGKAKMIDAQVQTALPFSVKMPGTPAKTLSSSESSGSSSFFTDQSKQNPSSVSIFYDSPSASVRSNISDKDLNPSNSTFYFPQNFSFGPSSCTVAMAHNNLSDGNDAIDFNISSNPRFMFNSDDFQNIGGKLTRRNTSDEISQPFIFTAVDDQNSENKSEGRFKRPSTFLGSSSSFSILKQKNDNLCKKKQSKPSSGLPFYICNRVNSVPTPSINNPETSQNIAVNFSNADETQNSTLTNQSFISTNCAFNNPSRNSNNASFIANSLVACNIKKRPTTNLYSCVTTPT